MCVVISSPDEHPQVLGKHIDKHYLVQESMIDSLYIHTIKQKPGSSLQVAKGHVNHPHSSFCWVESGLLPMWLSPVTEVMSYSLKLVCDGGRWHSGPGG